MQNLIPSRREREFFPNLEFREESENFFFKILTFESISRNENSILQLEIEKNGPFPLEISSRSRISSMPAKRLDMEICMQLFFGAWGKVMQINLGTKCDNSDVFLSNTNNALEIKIY